MAHAQGAPSSRGIPIEPPGPVAAPPVQTPAAEPAAPPGPTAPVVPPEPAPPPHVEPRATLAPPALPAPPNSVTAAPAPRAPSPNDLVLGGGMGNGFTIRTHDERYSLTLRGRAQVRFTVLAPNAPAESDPRASGEFVIRRLRVLMSGTLLSTQLRYYFQLGLSPQDMESDLLVPVRDAYVTYTGLRDLAVRVGQMKVPFSRQRVISSSALQFADRSIVNAELNLDRDIGVQLFSENLFGLGHRLGYQLGFFGGNGRNRLGSDQGFLYVARVQAQPFGRFEDIDHEGDFARGGPRLSVGAGVAFNHQTNRPLSTTGHTYEHARFDYLHAEADLLFKWAGFSLQGEWIYRHADRDQNSYIAPGEAPVVEWSRSAMGYMVQGAYQLRQQVEFGARWGHVMPFANTDPALRTQYELGAVVSWYPLRHSLKLQTDYFYLFGDDASRGRHQVRVQLQAYF